MSLLDRAARFIDDVLLLPEDVRDEVEDAERDLREGRPEDAERRLRAVLADRPSLLRARQGLALALRARGDLAGARSIATVSRQLDPDEPEVALLAAQLALEAGDLVAAVEEAREAARRAAKEGGPAFAAACVIRARAERQRGRPDRAARELRKALAADPDDEELRLELAEALASAGRGASAAAALHRLDLRAVDPDTALRLGEALAGVGEVARAKTLLARAAESGLARGSTLLATLALREGDLEAAEGFARTAVARRGGAEALGILAEVLHREGKAGEAAQALLSASEASGGDAELLRRAARLCPLDAPSELAHIADRLETLIPGDDAARAARAWSRLARGADARALVEAPSREPRLALARARIAIDDGVPQGALDILATVERFDVSDKPSVRSVRRDALRALWRGDGGIDLAAAIDEVGRFAEQRGLDDVQRRAHALRDELDRPLLLAILGEFNAGKSTLVNAFVGADVAPTGILPTTATLNLLRSGAERRVRVVRKDGTTREGGYAQLKTMLREADEAGDHIDHVEIVFPSELLERVWILDAPGSNAPIPEHEALAAEALRRADAALWVFDSGQAGKATEGRILSAIRASRRHVVGALNKVDRLSPEQLAQVRVSLARQLPELGTDEIPALSAKRALAARLAGDDEAFEASGFPALLARLEKDVFSRSRQLKRRACGGRLLALLDDALASEEDARAATDARVATLEALHRPLGRASSRLADVVDDAITEYEKAQLEAYDAAAVEVLAFVRPRTNRFAKHGADLEDRAFLAEVMEQRLDQVSASCESQLCRDAGEVLREPAAEMGIEEESLERRVRVAIAPAIARFAGFQEGVLVTGALRRFFEEDLPRAELAKEPLAEALAVGRVHPRERLRPALRDAVIGLADAMERERTDSITEVKRAAERVRDRVYEPLRALREVLEELAD